MPQHKAIVERINKTLMEKVRSMLNVVHRSLFYWVEVVDTTCYVVNRSSTLSLVDKTPYEAWASKRPLDVMPLCTYQKKEDKSSKVTRRSVSSPGTRMK